ncbi:peroxidase family protein [Neorhizobium galegae]|uniref:Myeloperoxidase, thyroid peroxidase, cyclooxygenase catalytic domain n=1 Tax=Neorhizobium galegae bv. officinalis TaxID=323656 RepID=A0A0T7GC40_NEOGA|nr:heme peroxidase family protein [Neorhizobium galegae]CDZ44758.1 Myeloperoxidase, thyroid peroxidase, cyclooxygenase catalytic domain [Neorhizobium galegae bv. officinalis]
MTEIAMHGHGVRGMKRETLHSFDGIGDPGKFGVMFPDLVPLFASDDALFELAVAMGDKLDEKGNPTSTGDNPNIPAGYTYLGQFIDHDITLDTTPLDQQHADAKATTNFRTPALDLDSLYGDGPGIHPYLYQRDPKTFRIIEKMLIGHATKSNDQHNMPIPGDKDGRLPNDLPRNQVGHALIFDERNDENLLVAQLHLLMLKFHNKVVDWLVATQPSLSGTALFQEARRVVTWHYQWIVLFDFVELLTEPGLVNKIKHQGRRFYRFKDRPYMPAEFAAAAYRLGHSMVRETYNHNRVFNPTEDSLANATFGLLFRFTGKSGFIVGELDPNPGDFPPNPQATLPSNWVIDWRRFFDLGTPAGGNFALNHSRLLDPFVTPALHTLPGHKPGLPREQEQQFILPFRNLSRGVQIGLPSGQDICRAMGIEPIKSSDIAKGADGKVAEKHGLHVNSPLWYYVLKEAEHYHQGKRLGPMASTIVAETFLGLVHGDKQSFLQKRSNWKPELPSATAGHFTMADLIRFVGDINPIG